MKEFSRHFWLESASREKLSGNAMSLATLLYLKANKEGVTWVSNDAIRTHFHWTKFTLSRARNNLFAKGLIKGPKSPTKSDPLRLVLVAEKRNSDDAPVAEKRNKPVAEKCNRPVAENRNKIDVPVAENRNKNDSPVAEKCNTSCGKVQQLLRKSATALYKEEPSKNHPGTNHHTGSTNADAEKKPAAPSKNPANGCGVSRDSMDQVLGIFNRQRLKRFALPPLEMSGAVKKPLQKILKMHPLEEVLLVAEDYCSWAAERYLHPRNCFALSKFEGKLQSALDQQNAKPLEPGLHRIRNREPDVVDLYFQQREHHETTIIDHADFENFEIPTPASTAQS